MTNSDLDLKFIAIGITAIISELSAGESISTSKYGESGKSWSVAHRISIIKNNTKVGNRRKEW